MITKVTTQYFKRFEQQEFPLEPLTLLAGPNNCGKSTLLQAIMVWNLAMQRWIEKKGPGSGSKAKERAGAPITRQEFSALPLREALKRVTSLELLLAESAHGIVYLEGNTDFDLLKAWAEVLDHPLKDWFKAFPFWHNNQGRSPSEARAHYFSLKAVRPDLRAVLVLDGDNRNLPDREISADGLTILRWERYESESYLIHPSALERFITQEKGELFASAALSYLREQIPPAFLKDPLQTSAFLRSEPVSKTLLPELLRQADLSTEITKSDYFLIARGMRKSEIPAEVGEKLTQIQTTVASKH
jgi:hypothetical protein